MTKRITNKKNSTSTSNKTRTKKDLAKKSWLKIIFIGLIAILVISTLSYGIVSTLNNNKAMAAYSSFGTINGVRFDYCKYYDKYNQLSYRNRPYNTQSSIATVYNYVSGSSYYPIRLAGYQASLGLGGGSQLSPTSTYTLGQSYRVDRGTNSTTGTIYFSFAKMGWC